MMIGIWLIIEIIMESIRNNRLILGLFYSGKQKINYVHHNIKLFFFRDIFYVIEECLIVAKLLCHLSNSVLRVINNDTYEEMPLVFNRLAPGVFTKNKVNYFSFIKKSGCFRIVWLYIYCGRYIT